MRRYRSVHVAGMTLALMIWAVPARAQETVSEAPQNRSIDITPFVSLGSHFSSTIGAAIAFAWTDNVNLEAEMGYRHGEMNAFSSSVNLVYDLPRFGSVAPYLAGGAGLEQYGTAFTAPGGQILTAQLAFTINAGGGLRIPIDKRLDFRTDARWFEGLGNAPEHWRTYNGITWRKRGR